MYEKVRKSDFESVISGLNGRWSDPLLTIELFITMWVKSTYHHSCNTDDSGENLNVKISTGGYSLGVQGDLHTQNDNMLTC